MQNRPHRSLHRLQHALCQELKNLELCQSSHKKAHSSTFLKSPVKNLRSIHLSESKYVRNWKAPNMCVINLKGKGKVETKKGSHLGCQQRNKEWKQHKLKKKGTANLKSMQNLWQMSNASTKCNDSKVDNESLSLSQLMKKNKQYQQIISNQRNLIKKLEKIIDESYDLSQQ